jgi:hypothetical protein
MRLQTKVCKKWAGCHITNNTAKPKNHGNIVLVLERPAKKITDLTKILLKFE